jgi:hypothetical protein
METDIALRFEASEKVEDLTIRVSSEAGDDLRDLLAAAGIPYSEILELSQTTETWTTVAAMIGSGGVGAWLGPLISSLGQRHKDKKIRLKSGDYEIDLAGYSPKEAERIFEAIDDERRSTAERWTEILEKTRKEWRGGDNSGE